MRITLVGVLVLFGLVNSGYAQIGLTPLNSNPTIQAFKKHHPDYVWNAPKKHAKWGTVDTLNLPFFEDFTSTLIYPDSSRWQNNVVYVNQDFAIHPPSYGVATFDYLDENGLPYSSLEKEFVEGGDTLTSQFINLGNGYTADDSIYLSFFYQARGLGDLSTEADSFKIQFRDTSGYWYDMWAVNGGKHYDFEQVLLPVIDRAYLHVGFQFRFINVTHRWGNNNHWHLDYIYLDDNRSDTSMYYPDYAIQSKPTSLLDHYYSMPYDHFMADVSEAADSFYFYVSNMKDYVMNAQVRHLEKNGDDTLVITQYNQNEGNVPVLGYAQRKVKGYDFTGLSGYPLVINRNYYVRESGITNPPPFDKNEVLTVNHPFTRHFAYDDGTAESGFGFNDLKTATGWVVVAFDLKKSDSLHAVDILLTYNTQDVSRQRFDFQVYSDIAINGGTDELVYEQSFVVGDIYESVDNRGFYTIRLEQPIELQAGKFYVGWRQDKEYNLTLGWDKNNGYLYNADVMNPNIYFNIGDGWIQNNNSKLIGAPMIRPIVGKKDPWTTDVQDVSVGDYRIYPNPADQEIHVPGDAKRVRILSTSGQVVLDVQHADNSGIDVSSLVKGLYIVQVETKQNRILNTKFIKR